MIKPVRILPVGLDFCVVHNPVIFGIRPVTMDVWAGYVRDGHTLFTWLHSAACSKKTLKIRQGL